MLDVYHTTLRDGHRVKVTDRGKMIVDDEGRCVAVRNNDTALTGLLELLRAADRRAVARMHRQSQATMREVLSA